MLSYFPASIYSRNRYPDKVHLRETMRLMRKDGKGYWEIGKQLGIDSSRVWQLFNITDNNQGKKLAETS